MGSFFKSIGKGILYFFTPFVWAIGISLGVVIGLVVFLFYALYSIFLFFTGRNLFRDLPEDEKVKDIKELQAKRTQEAAINSMGPAPMPTTNIYQPQSQENTNFEPINEQITPEEPEPTNNLFNDIEPEIQSFEPEKNNFLETEEEHIDVPYLDDNDKEDIE